jgi:hypothetical protein
MKEEATSVLAVKAMQEKTSLMVPQGTQVTEAAAVEKKKRRRTRGATTTVKELKMQVVEKKKQSDIEAMQNAEVAYVESMRKENATLHSTSKKDNTVAIWQQTNPVASVAHGNTHDVQIKDLKLDVEEVVVEELVELQVYQQNDVEVGD